jgi:electron transport complex protein RnfC
MLHKYPTGLEPILVRVLLRKTVPMDGSAFDVGAAVVTPALCWAAYRAVACDAPALGRIVTVVSEGAGRCGNWFVPFGARCADLAAASGAVVIHGGPLTGLACPDDAVVGPPTDAVLALPAPSERAGPCIRCGWCGDHCPARLNVAALNDMYELGQIAAASRAGALACVECGVCSYICPARLPLTQRVKQLKAAIRWRAKEGA